MPVDAVGPRWVWERDRVVRTGEAVCRERERERVGFSAVSRNEKVVEERECFRSGEATLFTGLNVMPRQHRKWCTFKKMLSQ